MIRPGRTKMIADSVPAAEAMVWTMLFSWMVEFAEERSTAIEITAAGIEVAKVIPELEAEIDVGGGEQHGEDRAEHDAAQGQFAQAALLRGRHAISLTFTSRRHVLRRVERQHNAIRNGAIRGHSRKSSPSRAPGTASRRRSAWRRRAAARPRRPSSRHCGSAQLEQVAARGGDAEEGHRAGHLLEHVGEILGAHDRRAAAARRTASPAIGANQRRPRAGR